LWIAASVSFFEADVTSTVSIAEAGKEIRKAHGDPTVLVSRSGSCAFREGAISLSSALVTIYSNCLIPKKIHF
jgi:hypothetical protein